MDKAKFILDLAAWYAASGRDLPWRQTKDPYAIWVSEAMLQQTQVKTALPYYQTWLKRFPTVYSLAVAEVDDVLSAWQGLGYYRRARNLHAGAKIVADHGFPETRAGWQELPGVGAYTAAAIASITVGEFAAVVDGNVERVYARVNADDSSTATRHRNCWKWAQELMDALPTPHRPGEWNQAMMELGATVCTPRNPSCVECPVAAHCQAHAQGQPTAYPTPVQKADVKLQHWHASVHINENSVALVQAAEGAWWTGMWTLPLLTEPPEQLATAEVKFTVTQHRIKLSLYPRCLEEAPTHAMWHPLNDLPAMPAPFRKALRLMNGEDIERH